MNHTFLFEEGLWKAEGFLIDEGGTAVPLSGESRITHEPDRWINESRMTMEAGGDDVTIENRYEFEPMAGEAASSAWTSVNPMLGTFKGRVAVACDSIISTFSSEEGAYSGTEFLLVLDPRTYLNRGVLYIGGRRMSSWCVELRRVE